VSLRLPVAGMRDHGRRDRRGAPRRRRRFALGTAAFLAAAVPASAWGPIGHRMVAETAALLVQDDLPATWGPLLARHRFELGVYAFLPDARFRHTDGNGGETEAPTHYLNLDDPAGARRGSLDRRIAQFLGRAAAQLKEVRAPKGGYQRGATAQGDSRRVYLGLYELGVLAHYTGDASMPYHATADWNGASRGEGGIHFYFEADCVNALEPGLAEAVLASARKNRARWLSSWGAGKASAPELARAVLADSLSAVEKVSELDRKTAILTAAPPGGKADAVRKPAREGCPPMRPLLVERLAKGAVLTAFLWESVLPGGVDFSAAGGLQFSDMETAPEYVPPPGNGKFQSP
jgi:hypothetical protein